MQLFNQNKGYFHAAARIILLAGLLFSNAEGISLLPFPATAHASNGIEKLAPVVDGDYHENVTRFEKTQNLRVLKKHKADSGSDAASVGGILLAGIKRSASYRRQLHSNTAVGISSQTYLSDLNGRPPPFS